MRGRSLIAALAAAAPVLLFVAAVGAPAFAQATTAATESDDPNAGGAAPADQQAASPDAATPAPADSAAPAAAPADDAGQPASDQPATTAVQTVPIPAAA